MEQVNVGQVKGDFSCAEQNTDNGYGIVLRGGNGISDHAIGSTLGDINKTTWSTSGITGDNANRCNGDDITADAAFKSNELALYDAGGGTECTFPAGRITDDITLGNSTCQSNGSRCRTGTTNDVTTYLRICKSQFYFSPRAQLKQRPYV